VNFSADVAVNTNTLFVDVSEAKVGIGTTSPDGKLDIEGDFEATKALVLTNTKGAGKVSYIRSHGANGEALSLYHDGQRRQVWDSTGYISFEGTGGEERMRIDSSGKVGIGTDSPTEELHLNRVASGGDICARIQNNTGTSGSTATLRFSVTPNSAFDSAFIGSDRFNALILGSNVAERARIDSSGNLGIGTDSPAARLDVHNGTALGGTNNDYLLLSRIHSFTGNQTYLEIGNIRDSTGSDWTSAGTRIQSKIDSTFMGYMQFNGTGNPHGISFGVGASTVSHASIPEAMRIESDGDVLIGTTDNTLYNNNASGANSTGTMITPSGEIQVARYQETPIVSNRMGNDGSVLSFYNRGSYVGKIQSTSTGVSLQSGSDRSLKQNIEDANDAGSLIDSVQIRQFDWIRNGEHQNYGVVAQELEEVLPELVSGHDEESLTVDYMGLVPMLIKEVQALRSRVAQLEESV